jgi:uncharacterized SAM-binding protein YcdF (DUF218 family)
MKSRLILWVLVVLLLAGVAAKAGSFLVVDAPQRSDVILVLAGETNRRPARALQLLGQGYGNRIILDVPTNATIYEFTQLQLAQQYIHDLPQGIAMRACPIDGLSTRDEARDAAKCLARETAKSVLIVTSDFHTRRALSTFRREIPQYTYSSAAARDGQQFGERWWKHRQWAKTFFDEWLRLIWWDGFDRWR